MKNKAIDKLLGSCGAVITYVPLRTEVPFREFVQIPSEAIVYEIKPRAALDPVKEAASAVVAAAGRMNVCILIPGRQFDRTGTRYGQGGGWYDRFLSAAPAEWTRIGFCFEHQFSQELLLRQSWDQVMDYVAVIDRPGGAFTVHETHARKPAVVPTTA